MCTRESIQVVGDSLGINPRVSTSAADHLARCVEARLQDVVQDAMKFMKMSNRASLSTEDINMALRLRHVDPLFGFSSSDPVTFRQTEALEDLFYIEDPVVDLKEILARPLPKVPIEPYFTAHWLAIEGTQPQIPQNPSEATGVTDIPVIDKKVPRKETKTAVQHVLSKEQQLYFEQVSAAVKGTDDILKHEALKSVQNDEGLHQLVPYFVQFIADEVHRNLKSLSVLRAMLRLASSLLHSQHLHIEPYLHQLMPPILTCLVGKRLCAHPLEDHWSLRDFAASLVALVCREFGYSYRTLQPRITKTLMEAFLNPTRPLTTHYGAITGLRMLGSQVIEELLLPHLGAYLGLLEPALAATEISAKRMEAAQCYSALLYAAGQYTRVLWESNQVQNPTLFEFKRKAHKRKKKETTLEDQKESFVLDPVLSSTSKRKKGNFLTQIDEKDQQGEKDQQEEEEEEEEDGDGPASLSLFQVFGERLLPYARCESAFTFDSWSLQLPF